MKILLEILLTGNLKTIFQCTLATRLKFDAVLFRSFSEKIPTNCVVVTSCFASVQTYFVAIIIYSVATAYYCGAMINCFVCAVAHIVALTDCFGATINY